MQDFPANSQKAKARAEAPPVKPGAEQPRLKQVATAETARRKRRIGSRLRETFFGGDARSAADHMVLEVIVPGIRDMMFDAMETGLQRMIYGESRRGRRSSTPTYSNLGHVAYNRMSQPSARQSDQALSRKSRSKMDFQDLILQSRSEAEDVIDSMFDVLSRFEVISVADLYELTGVQSSHTDNKWGWTSLQGARPRKLRDGGYLLDLPDPEPLN